MKKIGLVGCGAVVHNMYAKVLIGRAAYGVAYVCDTNPAQAASAANLFGAEAVSLDDIAEHADVVVISTPPSSHLPLVERCLSPGRTILCEKPFMTVAADAEAIVERAHASGSLLRVGHFRRMFPQLRLARELVSAGVVGDVTSFSVSEGGRFTWSAVSDYPVRDPTGGVLWDTGSHTLDMALFAAGLDQVDGLEPIAIEVKKDKPEPSHDFRAGFAVVAGGNTISGRIHVSRREALPNMIRVIGERGAIAFVPGLDDRLRITGSSGSVVVQATRSFKDLIECFDLQMQSVLMDGGGDDFAAERFVGQVRLLEALANA